MTTTYVEFFFVSEQFCRQFAAECLKWLPVLVHFIEWSGEELLVHQSDIQVLVLCTFEGRRSQMYCRCLKLDIFIPNRLGTLTGSYVRDGSSEDSILSLI